MAKLWQRLLQLAEQPIADAEAAAVGFGTATKGANLLNETLGQEMVGSAMAWQLD